jgi:hypothetical protein
MILALHAGRKPHPSMQEPNAKPRTRGQIGRVTEHHQKNYSRRAAGATIRPSGNNNKQ